MAATLSLAMVGGLSLRAQDAPADLRQFRVGMKLQALPSQGYTGLGCAAGGAGLATWDDFATCPADRAGRREVSFRYDDEKGTKVAGQAVLLSLVMDADGTVDAIRMQTDPAARLGLRKRGYFFGEQVMARYGESGWTCTEGAPEASQQPVGGVFVREHCEKTIGVRHLVIDRALYRAADSAPGKFTSSTSFEISLVHAGEG